MSDLNYEDSVSVLKGVGDSVKEKLSKIGIHTIGDLIENIPRSFDDYSRVTSISQVKPSKVTLKAHIVNVKSRYSKNGLPIVEAVARDASGQLHVTWFNQPYIKNTIKPDIEYFISGEFAQNYRYFSITNPKIEPVSSFPKHTARLVPLYGLTKGLQATTLRKLTAQALERTRISEVLPEWIVEELDLLPRQEAIKAIHFPQDLSVFEKAKSRLAFEELFVIMLASELNRQEYARLNSYAHKIKDSALKEFTSQLPFSLTQSQRIAAWKLLSLMKQAHPMNSLLQGDVGSGKTVVSLLVALNAIENQAQVALMAPTEILASQHMKTIESLLPAKYKNSIALLTGSLSKKDKEKVRAEVKSGEKYLIIGTHALLQDSVDFNNLQLVIVDEQHRFGVAQRKALQKKAKKMPHVLHMSATPIPRSIALTLYGELDVVDIEKKPSSRKPVHTHIISPDYRKKLYTKKVHEVIERGEQVFVVAPLIEDGESSNVLSVEKLSKDIKKYLPDARIAVVHGKLTADQKEAVMKEVKDAQVDILVATTVIEVGIDIPNATVMIVESADRFGLAQLHQLRGRVGRGEKESVCFLVPSTSAVSKRLAVMESEHNGYKLAEYDLDLRGPGAIYGTIQHGALDLRIANISDKKLIETSRETAKKFIAKGEKLVQYPKIHRSVEDIRAITNLN